MDSLTAEQVAQFKRDGFLSPLPLLDEAERQECLQGLARLEDYIGAPVNATDELKWRAKPYTHLPWVLRLGTDPRLLDVIETLIGPDIMLYTGTFFIKEPGSPTWADWHQDSTYHGYDPMEEVCAWVALTDASEEAGCMEMYPMDGNLRLMHHESRVVEHSVNRAAQRIVEPLDDSRAVAAPLKPGEFSLHHGLCPHRSAPNMSNHRRIGLGFNYVPAWLKPTGSFAMNLMLVRGEDRWNHFGHVRHPVTEFGPQELAEHEKTVGLYRDTYKEQEPRHEPLFAGR